MPTLITAPEAREALRAAESNLAAFIADAVAGLTPRATGAQLAAHEGAVALARHRLRGAQDRATSGPSSTEALVEEMARNAEEQEQRKRDALAASAAAGYPSLSQPSVRIDHKPHRGTHAENTIGGGR